MECYKRKRRYPKSNVGSKKCVKSKSKSRVKKKRKSSSSHKLRMKNSFISSNLYTNDFYPANYFFQNDKINSNFNIPYINNNHEGVRTHHYNSTLINSNTPHLRRRYLPSSHVLSRQFYNNNRKVSLRLN